MLTRRCEECLAEPNEQGACDHHPYARMITIDDVEAEEERALLRAMRQDRRRNIAVFSAVVLASLGVIGLTLNGPFIDFDVVVLMILLVGALAVLLPPIWMFRHAWQILAKRTAVWPVWLWSLAGLGGWLAALALTLGLTLAVSGDSSLIDAMWIVLSAAPWVAWGGGGVSVVAAWLRQRQQRADVLAEEFAEEAGAEVEQKRRVGAWQKTQG